MGIADVFTKEDRIEITASKLYETLKEAARADLFRNGVKNKIPYAHILCVMDGDADALAHDVKPVWHDARTDPPKTPGLYYGKKDDTNRMWLCDYRDGKWTLDGYPDAEVVVSWWAEYTAFVSGDD